MSNELLTDNELKKNMLLFSSAECADSAIGVFFLILCVFDQFIVHHHTRMNLE